MRGLGIAQMDGTSGYPDLAVRRDMDSRARLHGGRLCAGITGGGWGWEGAGLEYGFLL